MSGKLSDCDHEQMDAFLAGMADALASGRLSKPAFVEAMAYVMTALDIGNRDEALFCFEAGADHFAGYAPEPQLAVSSALRLPNMLDAPAASAAIIVMKDWRTGPRAGAC